MFGGRSSRRAEADSLAMAREASDGHSGGSSAINGAVVSVPNSLWNTLFFGPTSDTIDNKKAGCVVSVRLCEGPPGKFTWRSQADLNSVERRA